MITLFEENERKFDSLGLGVLKDALSCPVKESLNDAFTLTMEYPIKGYLYSKIKINRIIYCKSNPFDDSYQPFRIRSITKPIKGIVTVEAVHVSYDANGFPVKPISGLNLTDILNKIVNGEDVDDKHVKYVLVNDMPFTFKTNIYMGRTFKTNAPYNLRALIMGGDECLIKKYDAELQFNKFEISFLTKRGKDRGAKIIYGKNMTDLTNVSTNDMLYTGVYPYYHSENSSNETVASGEFKKAYIVGTKEFQDGWLSYSENGEPFHPITDSPIQIATEGDYYEKVYCWNEATQRFEEKIYNQSVMLVQDVLEPEWVTIDWSHFPTVICKARKKGYYKKSTDDSWGSIKGVGDTVFEASILNSGIMENIMLSFSEVVPPTSETENTEVDEVVHVELDDPIIPIDTIETKQMKHENILSLDLTSEFDEEPTQQQLKNKAEEYISKNKIGVSKDNITVSFIDLSQTTEGKKYEKFDHIEIGDTVNIIYEELGVNTSLRVISVEYDPILNRYNSIELGEKQDDMSSQIMQSGDNVSSLTNDVGYANVTTVNKLIANTVTAEWLEAVNAKLSKAAIEQLEVERINCKGIFEASQFTLDTLVSKLLIAENAQIAKTLEAGQIKVSGNINVKGGSIIINGVDSENQNETYFVVDKNGNLEANSVSITGGELRIGNDNFVVTNEGIMSAKMAYIEGTVKATSGEIGGFSIVENHLEAGGSLNGYVYIGPDKISLGNGDFLVDNNGNLNIGNGNFTVDSDGNATAKSIEITGGEILIEESSEPVGRPKKQFKITSDGSMSMNDGEIKLGHYPAKFGDYSIVINHDRYIPKRTYEFDECIEEVIRPFDSPRNGFKVTHEDFKNLKVNDDTFVIYTYTNDEVQNINKYVRGRRFYTIEKYTDQGLLNPLYEGFDKIFVKENYKTSGELFLGLDNGVVTNHAVYNIKLEILETLFGSYVEESIIKFEKICYIEESGETKAYTAWRFYNHSQESGKADEIMLIECSGIEIVDTYEQKTLVITSLEDATVKYVWSDNEDEPVEVTSYDLDQYIRTGSSKSSLDIPAGYNFSVDSEGNAQIEDANIKGKISVSSGNITVFSIEKDGIYAKKMYGLEYYQPGTSQAVIFSTGTTSPANIAYSGSMSNWSLIISNTFGVQSNGALYSSLGKIGPASYYTDGSDTECIKIGDYTDAGSWQMANGFVISSMLENEGTYSERLVHYVASIGTDGKTFGELQTSDIARVPIITDDINILSDNEEENFTLGNPIIDFITIDLSREGKILGSKTRTIGSLDFFFDDAFDYYTRVQYPVHVIAQVNIQNRSRTPTGPAAPYVSFTQGIDLKDNTNNYILIDCNNLSLVLGGSDIKITVMILGYDKVPKHTIPGKIIK